MAPGANQAGLRRSEPACCLIVFLGWAVPWFLASPCCLTEPHRRLKDVGRQPMSMARWILDPRILAGSPRRFRQPKENPIPLHCPSTVTLRLEPRLDPRVPTRGDYAPTPHLLQVDAGRASLIRVQTRRRLRHPPRRCFGRPAHHSAAPDSGEDLDRAVPRQLVQRMTKKPQERFPLFPSKQVYVLQPQKQAPESHAGSGGSYRGTRPVWICERCRAAKV